MRDRFTRALRSRWAVPLAVLLGAIENSIFIFFMEPLFIPMMASRGRQAWRIALALVVGAVIGGLIMYAFGMWADERIIRPLFEQFGATETYLEAGERLQENGFGALFLIALTPFPFQLGAAAAGAASYPILPFIAAVSLGRAGRYFFYAFIVMLIGARAQKWVENNEFEIFIGGMVIFVVFILWSLFGG
ncbi:MAG: VTT domain-containing protein [Pseudomonadota bacterium]